VIRGCGVSDIGRVRKTNEDSFVSDPETRLFAVADGMGGHNAGEVASRLAIEALTEFIRRSATDTDFSWPCGLDETLSFAGNRLRTAIHLANRRVFRAAESTDDYNGMGTTIVGLLVNGGRVSIGHVGDSRLYLLSNGHIEQLTQDDSWAATILTQDPTLGPADIARHPMRNVLTNVLGAREQVDIHLSERDLTGGERLVLSSDGLHGVLSADAIKQILDKEPDVEKAARALVQTALERGSRDNVTALVVRYDADK
jgi:serine/threonine protein phosphatase PrpC